jgi:hypothetical protein
MKLPRRRFLQLAAGAAAYRTAHAQAYRGTHHEPVTVGPFRPAVLLWRTAPAPAAISQCILAWR